METIRKTVTGFLQKALSDELDRSELDQFVSTMNADEDRLANDTLHALIHFVVDSDIRSADAEYDKVCRDKLRSYIDSFKVLPRAR